MRKIARVFVVCAFGAAFLWLVGVRVRSLACLVNKYAIKVIVKK